MGEIQVTKEMQQTNCFCRELCLELEKRIPGYKVCEREVCSGYFTRRDVIDLESYYGEI